MALVHKTAAAALTLATAVALSSCSSTNNGQPHSGATFPSSTSHSASSASSSSSTSADRATLAGPQLITQVLAAMKAASGFRVVATTKDSGQSEHLDLHFGASTASGSVTVAGSKIELISAAPYVYMKASDAFWKSQLPASQQAQILPLIAGKWVKAYASNSNFKDLASVLDRTSFIASLGNGNPPSSYVNLGKSSVGSVPAIRLKDTADGSLIDIAASGAPYPLQAQPGKADGPGLATFSGWNQPFSATEPPASEVFDLSTTLGK